MPEGDTIHRLASRLDAALGHGPLLAFRTMRPAPGPYPEPGTAIVGTQALGKHLLTRFADGPILHTHLRMRGSWRLAGPADHPPGRPSTRSVVVETAAVLAAGIDLPVVELLSERDLLRHPVLSALGPDLCLSGFDLETALARLDALDPTAPVAVALLDQRVAAGIGNVYRSEVLWACRQDPFAPLAEVGPEARRRLYGAAHDLLRANLGPGPRRTVPDGLAVYDRAGRACLRCGGRITVGRIGDQARAAWWCPACQTDG
jgi:endonuclease VIII